MPVGTEADQEVDFKEVSEEQALSILKVGPAAAAAARRWHCPAATGGMQSTFCTAYLCTSRLGGWGGRQGGCTMCGGLLLVPWPLCWGRGWRSRRLAQCPSRAALGPACMPCMQCASHAFWQCCTLAERSRARRVWWHVACTRAVALPP